jgi:tRNA-binding protein
MKSVAQYASFAALDIRVGRVVRVEDAQTKKPTYRITVDFGPEIGTKVSCGAFRNYAPDFLLGKQVIGVVNFEAKRMGPEISEALILGVPGANGETILLVPQQDVGLGAQVF